MASLETLSSGARVVWRQGGAKQYERFSTRTAAEKFKALVEAHDNRWPHGWIPGHGYVETHSKAPTLDEWAPRAINTFAKANDRSRHDYLRDYNRHISPTLGALHIDLISKEAVGNWLRVMLETSSPKTVKNVQGMASAVMKAAIDDGLAARNPFEGAMKMLPAAKVEEMVFLTRTEFDTLLTYVADWYKPLVSLLALTGLRWSEATALRVADVDLMGRRLTVAQAWKRTPESYFVIGEPKSRRSRRTITISPKLRDILVPLVMGRADGEFLFTSRTGRPIRHANFRQRVWLPAVHGMQRCDTHKDAAEPCLCPGTVAKRPRIHDMRHSHASWLIAAKVSLPAIQRRLGHESIQTTIDRYGHLVPETDDEISAALDGEPVRDPALV